MNAFARFALAIAVVLALVGLASAQIPNRDHRVTPHPVCLGSDEQITAVLLTPNEVKDMFTCK
jgi:hypothetical protein